MFRNGRRKPWPTGTVYQRTNKGGTTSWVAHATWREGGKRRQAKRVFATKREARDGLVDLLAAHRTGQHVDRSRITLADYVADWLAALPTQGRRASTISGYRQSLENYVLPTLGQVELQDLRATDLDKLYASLRQGGGRRRGQPLSLTTIHTAHTVLSKVLNDAERKGFVIRNVARLADPPTANAGREERGEQTIWTPEELRTFLDFATGHPWEMAFRLLAMTGIRRSELVGLRWTDVDFAGRRLMIRQAVTAVRGAEVVDAPKSRRSRRNVDLDDITLAMLDRYRTEQRADLLALGIRLGPEDRIFRAPSGSPVRPDTVGQAFRRLAERSGLPVIRLHDLRHTHASHLLAAGVNVKIVSERLGHASTSFTMDTYGHVLPGQQAEAARVAASLVATGTTTLPEQLR